MANGDNEPPRKETALRVGMVITASAVISLAVSVLTGTMNVGGYIEEISENKIKINQVSAQTQVLMLAEAQEKTLIDALSRSIEKLSTDRDQAYGANKVIAERLATLEAELKSGRKRIEDLQADYAQHRKTEEEVLKALNNKLDSRNR